MRVIIGKPPDDSTFEPENEPGWRKIREMGPGTVVLVGTLAGIPLAALFVYPWSQIPGTELSFRIDAIGLGRWGAVLFPFYFMVTIGVFFISLILVHELVHVVAYPNFGLTSSSVLGVWPSRFLAYANHSGPVTVRRFILVALAPLTVLSILPLLAAFVGGLHWPFLAFVSIINAFASGGDVAICLMIAYQVPFTATLRNKGWDTWWRLTEQSHEPESPSGL